MEGGNACKLCFEIFNEKRRPQVLPCGHTYCNSCIISLFGNGRIKCPKCRLEHKAANVKEFPINYDLEESLSNSKKTEASVAPKARQGHRSKKLQTLIDEERSSSLGLILCTEELESQMKDYDNFLVDKKEKHEEIFQKILKLAKRNEEVITIISSERKRVRDMQNNVIGVKEEMKEKLQTLDDAADTKSAVAAVDELDQTFAALEDWNEKCQQFPDANLLTFSNKVLIESKAALSMVDSESDQNVPEIPDLSKTNFTILEKLSKICGKCTLSIDKFQKMSKPIKNLLKEGRIYAIKETEGRVRSARLSQRSGQIYLHCLQDGEAPADFHTIQYEELLNVVTIKNTKVFMDLSWEGSFRGRITILLSPDTPLARQFRMLCTGDLGSSYVHSNFLRVFCKGNPLDECVYAGDYQYNDGRGGASIIEGIERNDPRYKRPWVEGIVGTGYDIDDESRSAQFRIKTGKGNPSSTYNRVFGQVQDGLDVVRSAAKLNDIKSVLITDCGVVIPL